MTEPILPLYRRCPIQLIEVGDAMRRNNPLVDVTPNVFDTIIMVSRASKLMSVPSKVDIKGGDKESHWQ